MSTEGWVVSPGYVFVRPEGEDESPRQALAWRFAISGHAQKGPQLTAQAVALRSDGTLEVVEPVFVSWGKPTVSTGTRKQRDDEVDALVMSTVESRPPAAKKGELWAWGTPEIKSVVLASATEGEVRSSLTRLIVLGKLWPLKQPGSSTLYFTDEGERDGWARSEQ